MRSGATMCALQDGSYASSTPTSTAGQTCQWLFRRRLSPPAADQRTFVAATQQALQGGLGDSLAIAANFASSSHPIRTNPSPSPARRPLRGRPNGTQASVTVTPKDRLVIGFGDSFTSGEGNPELTWPTFPAHPGRVEISPLALPIPFRSLAKDTRAQWTDRWRHRSVYSWQIRTALAAARATAPVLHHSPLWLLGRHHPGGHPLRL